MKAIQIIGGKGAHQIRLTDILPKPIPQGGDILVKVLASGITAPEVTWPELYATSNRVPGHDISGIVEKLGPDYDGSISEGDHIFAMLRADAPQGGQAEYAIASPDEVALKPSAISHTEAAALPIPALTAWEGIFEHAKPRRNSKILVTGASGAVGVMVIQMANKLLEAETIGLASANNHAYLKELGASQVFDYTSPNWHQTIKDIDVVFDTVGGATLDKSWSTVKNDGVIITVADPPPDWAFGMGNPELLQEHPNVRRVYFVVAASGETLQKVATLLDDGSLKPLLIKSFPIDRAVEAWTYGGQRGRQGKAVIMFASEV